jgi:hypothetical protein
MIPERDRLARTLLIAAPLRSLEGISALQDLIALRTTIPVLRTRKRYGLEEVAVQYRPAARRLKSKDSPPLLAPLLLTERVSIVVKERWKHVYRCSKDYYGKQSGFAEFCFRCSR